MEFYVPSYLKELLDKYWKHVDNFSLRLEKFVPFVKDRNSGVKKPRIDKFGIRINLPKVALKIYERFFNHQKSLWKSKIEEFYENPNKLLFTLKTKSRLVVGLGDESVYETSIRLHRNYGIPYIPGSALKGVAKHYVIYKLVEDNFDTLADKFGKSDFFELAGDVQKLFENDNDVKEYNDLKLNSKEISLNDLRKIFGTQSYEGSVVFFDAFPTPEQFNQKSVLELDIMNPHYGDYYSASESDLNKKVEKAPGDWHSPNPIFFLTVPESIEFQFAIAPRNEEGVKLSEKAKELLISALREQGVGAKTALGYGRLH